METHRNFFKTYPHSFTTYVVKHRAWHETNH
jgi:hypothetical protein